MLNNGMVKLGWVIRRECEMMEEERREGSRGNEGPATGLEIAGAGGPEGRKWKGRRAAQARVHLHCALSTLCPLAVHHPH